MGLLERRQREIPLIAHIKMMPKPFAPRTTVCSGGTWVLLDPQQGGIQMLAALNMGVLGTILVAVLVIAGIFWLLNRA
jgi:hypothetical protein